MTVHASHTSLASLTERAYNIRRHALRMGQVQGQGYVGQALGAADLLAVSYFHALRYQPENPEWEGRDRFYLSIGHYAIALYAALIEGGVIRWMSWKPTVRMTAVCRCRAWPLTPRAWRSPVARSGTDWGSRSAPDWDSSAKNPTRSSITCSLTVS